MLNKLYNLLNAQTEYSGPQIAHLLNKEAKDGSYYSSHLVRILNLNKFNWIFKFNNNIDHMKISTDYINEEFNDSIDYIHRSPELENLNLYDFTRYYIKGIINN